MSDAIELLLHDHQEVEQMFTEFDTAADPDERRRVADRIIIELVRHSEAEEQVVYPVLAAKVEDGRTLVEHEIKEHTEAEKTMKRLDGMDPRDPEFGVLMQELMKSIRHHIREEESEAFPKLRRASSKDELETMGTAVQAIKKIAPTHPHPSAPDHPPFNALLGPGAGLIDRVRDLISGRGKD